MKKIPFSPPRIDEDVVSAVTEVLRSGWITTGPKTKLFEKRISEYTGAKETLCLNSATAGLELMLRWYGVEPGDEVIIPAYTYSATANVIVHCGAIPVMVDVDPFDFNIDIEKVKAAITSKTKVIMPVDFAGLPCKLDLLNSLVRQEEVIKKFVPRGRNQQLLGRILVLSDAAHSFGAVLKEKKTGSLTDVSVFSFHAVKNLTTAEGGAIALHLPEPFNNKEVYDYLCMFSLHGQNKDALAKMGSNAWKYDILEAGFKCNMTDICAAIGLIQLDKYSETLDRRKKICDLYSARLGQKHWAQLPVMRDNDKESSYHLYPLRIKSINEDQRAEIITMISDNGISVNVHFIPLPLLSFYKNKGYEIGHYPVAYNNYSREISLPVYYDLSDADANLVVDTLIDAVEKVIGKK